MSFLFIPALLILMYFLLLRPNQQRVRRQRELVMSVGIGDEVVTAGGMIGRIAALDDDRAEIEVADGVTIEFLRAAINRKLEPRTYPDDSEISEDDVESDEPSVGGPDSPPEESR